MWCIQYAIRNSNTARFTTSPRGLFIDICPQMMSTEGPLLRCVVLICITYVRSIWEIHPFASTPVAMRS
jgi:hypothetical protein